MSTAERVRLPDDCTVGYIVEGLLGARLLHSTLFHSHLENLQRLPSDAVLQQVEDTPAWPGPTSRGSPSCPGLASGYPCPWGVDPGPRHYLLHERPSRAEAHGKSQRGRASLSLRGERSFLWQV